MARKPGHEVEVELYHLITRGVERRTFSIHPKITASFYRAALERMKHDDDLGRTVNRILKRVG